MSKPHVFYNDSRTDRDAREAAEKYQKSLLGTYLPTTQQTTTQGQELLGQGIASLGPQVREQEEQDRLAQLSFLQEHGREIYQAYQHADPRSERLLNIASKRAGQYAAPTDLDQLLDRNAMEAGPSNLSRLLGSQAEEQLALGGGLSPEETRQSDQAARGAWADRGLINSNPAMLQEVLNRTSLSDARLAGRQNFAGNVNSQLLGEQAQNRSFQLGVGGYEEGGRQNVIGNQLNIAGARNANNPLLAMLSRPTNTGLLLGGSTAALGAGGEASGQLLGFQDQYAGFLMNRLESRNIADLNLQAGIQSGQIQAAAAGKAGNKQLIGAGIGAAAAIAGAVIL